MESLLIMQVLLVILQFYVGRALLKMFVIVVVFGKVLDVYLRKNLYGRCGCLRL